METKINLGSSYMNVISFGSGDKNLVIVSGVSLTGLEGMGDAIAGALNLLGKNFKVYLFDRLKELPQGYSTEDMAEDVYMCLEKLGVEHAYVYGASHGGMISQVLAIKHPEMVDKLVICSSISRNKEVSFDTPRKWLEIANEHNVEKLNQMFLDTVYSPAYVESIKDMIPSLLKSGTAKDCDRFACLMEAILLFDVFDTLDKIQCPVYVICDKNDHVFGPKPSYEMAEKLGCELYVYDQFSHAVYDEAPDFQERISNFFLA